MSYTKRPFNPKIPHAKHEVGELIKVNKNFEILANAFFGGDPTSGVLKSSVYTFRRVNLTSATSDYELQVGEEAYISFNDTMSVPLRIATTDGTYYEFDLIPSNLGGRSGGVSADFFLNPNNTTYTNAFVYAHVYRSQGIFDHQYLTYNSFRIGVTFSSVRCSITNRTVYKNIKGIADGYGRVDGFPLLMVFSTDWRDTTTPWTSLGTIIFPQPSSGEVLVRRLL